MSIRTQILIPLLAFLLLGAAVSGFIGWQSLSGFAGLAALSDKAINASDASRTARDGFDRAEQLVARVLAMTDLIEPAAIEPQFRTAVGTTAVALAQLNAASLTPAMSGTAQKAVDHFAHWQTEAEVLLGLRSAKAIATLEVMRRSGDDIRALLDQAVALAGQDARTQIAEENSALTTELRIVFGVALALALAGALGAFRLARHLSQPLSALVASAERLAKGDVSVVIGAMDRNDEVGDIARAVDVFRVNVTAQLTAQSEATEQRRLGAEERQMHDQLQSKASREQGTVMEAVAAAMKRLACGDLTSELSNFPGTYKALETDFNAALAQLRNVIRDVTADTHVIHSATQDMSATADDLSQRTEQQAEELDRAAQALDRITTTVRDTAKSAKHAHGVVAHAQTEAEKSGSVVRDAVQAMSELERSSGQISQIIGVIDEIAFQTNLLALNAGVEAARAGDSGRGFAVVASEVRALAQRSADAAREIKQLISASSRQIGSGVGLVKQTGAALERIMTQVGEINTIVTSISSAASEQARGLDDVNAAVADMGQTTLKNAALVQRSAGASRDLAGEADRLADMMAQFTVTQAEVRDRRSAAPRGDQARAA